MWKGGEERKERHACVRVWEHTLWAGRILSETKKPFPLFALPLAPYLDVVTQRT